MPLMSELLLGALTIVSSLVFFMLRSLYVRITQMDVSVKLIQAHLFKCKYCGMAPEDLIK